MTIDVNPSNTTKDPHAMLNNITIIMVETTLPANIGSAARAMHTMGLSRLSVVNPKLAINESSYANAAGGSCVLDNATIVANIQEALAPCSLVFAASARLRHLPHPVITPDECANIIKQVASSSNPPNIAILFGREDRGLTNSELSYADYHVQIPANPAYPVLNVASAIQVIAAAIYACTQQNKQASQPLTIITRTDWDEPAINCAQKQKLQDHIIALMCQLNLARDTELKDLPKRLLRLVSRLQLDQKEYALLCAVIAKLSNNKTP